MFYDLKCPFSLDVKRENARFVMLYYKPMEFLARLAGRNHDSGLFIL